MTLSYVGNLLPINILRLDKGLPLPKYAHLGDDAGMDLFSADTGRIDPLHTRTFSVGISIEVPKGYVGLVHPRSGLAFKKGITVLNAPGTIDAGYTGEIKVALHNTNPTFAANIKRGDRIAQIVFQKIEIAHLVEVDSIDELGRHARGRNGYGSTG